jgi:hypothetical protein
VNSVNLPATFHCLTCEDGEKEKKSRRREDTDVRNTPIRNEREGQILAKAPYRL